jgi:hypothetical protein
MPRFAPVWRNRQTPGEFVSIQRSLHQTGRLLTTVKTIAAEREIVRQMREGQSQDEPVMSRQNAHHHRGPAFVLERRTEDRHRRRTQFARPCSGNSRCGGRWQDDHTGEVIRSAAEAEHYQVEGFAPTSRAAKQLEQAGVRSGTLQGFLARAQNAETELQHKRFFFIDESSLASTNQMREFLQRMGSRDRVLLIGDTRQHQGVEAGRPFQQLQEAGMNTAKLEEIVRQKDPALKATVEMLAHGQTAAAIEALKERGRVKQIVDPQERIQTLRGIMLLAGADPNRLSRQCLTARVESGRTPRIEGTRQP